MAGGTGWALTSVASNVPLRRRRIVTVGFVPSIPTRLTATRNVCTLLVLSGLSADAVGKLMVAAVFDPVEVAVRPGPGC